MSKPTIEDRLRKLESQMTQLLGVGSARLASLRPGHEDWKSTIGIFQKGDGMKEVFDEALKLREAHRQKFYKAEARRQAAAKRRRVKS